MAISQNWRSVNPTEARIDQLCQWFALCVREAVTTRPHPVLGDVPICKECNDKMDRLSQ